MALRRSMCKNIILHTSMPKHIFMHLRSLHSWLPHPYSDRPNDLEGLHFNIIYLNLGCLKF